MQPQDPLQPPIPPTAPAPPADPLPPIDPLTIAHSKDSILDGPDPKKNPFGEHIARPKEVPLAKPEYVHPDQAAPIAIPDEATATQQAYSYISQSPKVVTKPSQLTNSLPKRIAVVAVGLLFLLVMLSVGKGLLSPKPKLAEVVATVQRQQAILHVIDGALQQQSLSETNKSFALTTSLALGTSESQLITYLQGAGTKLKPQDLGLKISATVDSDLAASVANNAYNPAFKQTMETQLTAYSGGLKQAYLSAGSVGRKLLKDDYNQAQLLLLQLHAPGN
jgi:hypothetical protein